MSSNDEYLSVNAQCLMLGLFTSPVRGSDPNCAPFEMFWLYIAMAAIVSGRKLGLSLGIFFSRGTDIKQKKNCPDNLKQHSQIHSPIRPQPSYIVTTYTEEIAMKLHVQQRQLAQSSLDSLQQSWTYSPIVQLWAQQSHSMQAGSLYYCIEQCSIQQYCTQCVH